MYSKYASTCFPGTCAGWADTVLSRDIVEAPCYLGETDITQRTREIKIKLVPGGDLVKETYKELLSSSDRILIYESSREACLKDRDL